MIELIILLVVIGVALHLVNSYVPMARPIKTIVNVVVVLGVCIWVLRAAGIVDIPIAF